MQEMNCTELKSFERTGTSDGVRVSEAWNMYDSEVRAKKCSALDASNLFYFVLAYLIFNCAFR